MDATPQPKNPEAVPNAPLHTRAFGVGNAGVHVLDFCIASGFEAAHAVAIDTAPLTNTAAGGKLQLDKGAWRGVDSSGDAERGQFLAEEQTSRIKALCEGMDVVFILAGLGGGAGTGISPVLARIAKETGALVLGFVTTPFDFEGSRRKDLAVDGFASLQAAADGVICLPNQKVIKLLDESTSFVDAFKRSDALLADAVRGILRLLTHKGLIDIHFADLCSLLRDQHSDSAFAVAEASGATRSREVLDRIFAHPLLDGGAMLSEATAVLVSLIGGPDLTMTEVSRVMEEINGKCDGAQITMGAAIAEEFRERLVVTLIASRKPQEPAQSRITSRTGAEPLQDQLLNRTTTRSASRFVPPPPTLPPEQVQQMLAHQRSAATRSRKPTPKLRQTQLPLEIVSKGRFDKSEPTIHKGEDLDVPTYIRRGVALN
jgi:cell division protein FtsZ